MKKHYLIFVLMMTTLACKTNHVDYTKSDLNTITLFNSQNQVTSVQEIKNEWNQRLLDNENVDAKISNLEIIHLEDQKSNQKVLVLLGNTYRSSVKTATKLLKHKDGLKLSNLTVTCENCASELNIELYNENWRCLSSEESSACTKIVTMTGI